MPAMSEKRCLRRVLLEPHVALCGFLWLPRYCITWDVSVLDLSSVFLQCAWDYSRRTLLEIYMKCWFRNLLRSSSFFEFHFLHRGYKYVKYLKLKKYSLISGLWSSSTVSCVTILAFWHTVSSFKFTWDYFWHVETSCAFLVDFLCVLK